MLKRRSVKPICIVTLVLQCAACATPGGAPQSSGPLSDGLVLIPGAEDVRRTTTHDGGVVYYVRESFPGSGALRRIAEKLRASGWQETDDWIFPTDRPRGADAWAEYEQSGGHVAALVKVWKNTGGALSTYEFKYETPRRGDPQVRLEVSAFVMSRERVDKLKKLVK